MRRVTKSLIAVLLFCQGGFLIPEARGQTPASPVEQADDSLSGLGPAVTEERLAGQDGRQDIQIDQLSTQVSEMNSNANVNGNNLSAVNSTLSTGINSIGQDAFSNASGIVTVIQNSGNQVLIQSDMILNLWVK